MADDDFELLSDQELVELTRDGEKEAYAILWKRYFSAGMTCAEGVSRLDPEDLVVEAYTKILSAIRSGGGPTGAFRPYLYAAIRNLAITKSQKVSNETVGLEEASWGTMSVEGEVMSSIDSERITRVFYAMRPTHRKILWLAEVEEKSAAEIAEEMGMTRTNVSTSSLRARREFVRLWTQDHVRTDGVEPGSEHEFTLTHAGEYLVGQPKPAVQARIEAHLQECHECDDKLQEAKTMSSMFRSRVAPAVTGTVMSVVMASDRAFAAEVSASGMPRTLKGNFRNPHTPVQIGAAAVAGIVLALGGIAANTVTMSDELPASAPQTTPPPAVAPVTPAPAPPSDEPVAPASPSPKPSPVVRQAAPAKVPAPAPAAPAAKPKAKPKAAAPKKAELPAIVIVSVDSGPSGVCYPVVSGTARAGSTVAVSNGGRSVSVVAGAGGRWVTPQLTGFSAGKRAVTASSPDGSQKSASGTVTVGTPPRATTRVSGGQLTISINHAVTGIPVDVMVDGIPVGTLVGDQSGVASLSMGVPDSGGKMIEVRYHPAGCVGAWYGLETGL